MKFDRKAVVLFSGGLDSVLAARMMQDQKVQLHLVNFLTIFCSEKSEEAKYHQAEKMAQRLGLNLKVFEITQEVLDIVKKPKYGYGKNLNPCVDCRIFTFKKAKKYMEEIGASFIVTGEVLGERPMSQRRDAIRLIEKESGLDGLIVRPLSAKLMKPSIPEKEGWVDGEKFLAINGRGRNQQMKLARKYGIKDYATPSGGCLLTDIGFSKRLKDLMNNGGFDLADVLLLKTGRHFRVSDSAKVIVGRDNKENQRLISLAKEGDLIFDAQAIPGPVALYRGKKSPEHIKHAAEITVRYTDSGDQKIKINYWQTPDGQPNSIETGPATEKFLSQYRI